MDATALFPLQLSPFEEYMIKDERPAFPMIFSIRLRLSGTVHEARFENAVTAVLHRHPLLNATLTSIGKNRHQWREFTGSRSVVRLRTLPADRDFPEARIVSLFDRPGLQIELVGTEQGQDVVFQFHHACTDGKGALQFIEDLLIAYDVDSDKTLLSQRLATRDPMLLRDRARRKWRWGNIPWMVPNQVLGLIGACKFFLRFPRPIVPQSFPKLDMSPPKDFPTITLEKLTAHELAAIRKEARETGTTTYEQIVGELFLAMREFCSRRHPFRPWHWLRVNIPMDLRTEEHKAIPAANIVSMVFLDRRGRGLREKRRLVRSIHGEMWRIKRFDVKYTFVQFARLLWLCTPLYELLSRSRTCYATAILTNLGQVLVDLPVTYDGQRVRMGDARIESVDLVAPYRPLSSVAFSLVHYASDVYINLHHDPRALSRAEAKELIDTFLRRLKGSDSNRPSLEEPVPSDAKASA